MGVKNGNVKAINVLGEYRGGEKAVLLEVHFDLVNTASTGGTDTIQLGGGGQLFGVTTTQTLVSMIQNNFRGAGGTFTMIAVMGPYVPGYQAGLPLFATAPAISGSNVGSIAIQTAATGGSGQSTTSAGWDSAASILVLGVFANQGA